MGTVAKALMEKGFLQLLQRVPASKAEKALAGYDKRPAAFKRDSIAWSDENALKLVEAFGKEVEVEKDVKLGFSIDEAVEHVGSDAATPLQMAKTMATELRAQLESEDAGVVAKAEKMLMILGVEPDASEEALVEACNKFRKDYMGKK